jgi:hypothetical protein
LLNSIISIINIDLTVDTNVIVRKLNYYLTDDVIQCFNKIFEGKITIEEKSLSELLDNLSGRTYTSEKILDIVREWIGINKGLIKVTK